MLMLVKIKKNFKKIINTYIYIYADDGFKVSIEEPLNHSLFQHFAAGIYYKLLNDNNMLTMNDMF
jgi:hypothetical protein